MGELDPSGLIVVVGPNSSGKSQLLHDIYKRLSGEPRKLVVATELLIRKPDLKPFLSCLEKEGYITNITDAAGNSHIRPQTTFIGSGQAVAQIPSDQPSEWYGGFSPVNDTSFLRKSDFLSYFGRLLVTALFLERRLTSVGKVGAFDFENQAPQHDLHSLYIDEEAKDNLLKEVISTFGKALWVDASKANVICLRVSDQGRLPTAEERLKPKKMIDYRTIETEGDGLKCYVATCIALLLGQRPICIIDEPEMCLHPPQAYNLGRFIGRFGGSEENCTLVATHSSQILRGVIQTAPKIQIIRLTHNGGIFQGHRVDPERLTTALKKPTVRAETVLDGIFAQGVVIVEADTDRTVYQAAWETLHEKIGLDIHFTPVGGTGGIADTLRLYRTLKVSVAIIADLDLLFDQPKLKSILEILLGVEHSSPLITEANEIALALQGIPPAIDSETVKQKIKEIAEAPTDWKKRDDVNLQKLLGSLSKDLDRMGSLKRKGVEAFPDPIKTRVTNLINTFEASGLFLVPVMNLEGWLGQESITASRNNKWAWANEAAGVIRSKGPQNNDVWGFMLRVGKFLQ